MGPPSYMRSVIDRNAVMRRVTVLHHKQLQKIAMVGHFGILLLVSMISNKWWEILHYNKTNNLPV